MAVSNQDVSHLFKRGGLENLSTARPKPIRISVKRHYVNTNHCYSEKYKKTT